MTNANRDQIEYWNSAEARRWVEQQWRYDAMLEPYARRLLGAAEIAPHERVLDVGCGTGTTTLAAAAGAREALGVDISEPMIARARDQAREQGLANARFEVADAQTAPFETELHDIVISRFGVMFFDDPVAAFANLRKAMRRNGRTVFVCWQNLADNEWVLVPVTAAAEHVPLPDVGEPGAPGPFALGDAERLRALLTRAGFGDVGIQPLADSIVLGGGGTVDDVVDFFRSTSMGRALFANAAPDDVARAIDAVREALAPYQTPEGVRLGAAAWLVSARTKPS
jgi:SAM-dependent methyltransferase